MELRITLKSKIYIEGEKMQDCVNKWKTMPLADIYNKSSFVEICSVEDASTFEDKTKEWDKHY